MNMNSPGFISKAQSPRADMSLLARSFINRHLQAKWAGQQGKDQSAWAMACENATLELAQHILAIRSGAIPCPENITQDFYLEVAKKRREIAKALGHPAQYGEMRQPGDDLYTFLYDGGTYASQFNEVRDGVLSLSDLNGQEAAPGLSWKVSKVTNHGLAITTVDLVDTEGRIMQTLQLLKAEEGKTLGNYIEQLKANEPPKWHEVLTKSAIAQDISQKKEAALIIHTPFENLKPMLHKADADVLSLIKGAGDKEEKQNALSRAAWILGVTPSVRGGGASTTDIFVKALMVANNMEVTPYRGNALGWDLTSMIAPSQESFVTTHQQLFKRHYNSTDVKGWSNELVGRLAKASPVVLR